MFSTIIKIQHALPFMNIMRIRNDVCVLMVNTSSSSAACDTTQRIPYCVFHCAYIITKNYSS